MYFHVWRGQRKSLSLTAVITDENSKYNPLTATASEGNPPEKTPPPHVPPQTKPPSQPMPSQEPDTKGVETKTSNPPQQEPDVRPNKVNPPFKKNQWNNPPGN